MNNFKKNIFKIVTDVVVPLTLEQGSRSSANQTVPENGCALSLVLICYFDTITNGVITSGDTIYADVDGINVIVGGNQYYKVSLISTYIVLISDQGVMNVHSICA